MASIIPGYEYDIIISYRCNYNHSGWVTMSNSKLIMTSKACRQDRSASSSFQYSPKSFDPGAVYVALDEFDNDPGIKFYYGKQDCLINTDQK